MQVASGRAQVFVSLAGLEPGRGRRHALAAHFV
jgi:hypothetical protein